LEGRESWWPENGDGKSWEALHWALTGRLAGDGPATTRLFGVAPMDECLLADWNGVLGSEDTARLATDLQAVTENDMRARLAELPESAYGADTFGDLDERDNVVADATSFVRAVADAAGKHQGLFFALG
jgi:hypothetical protein